MTPVQDKLLVAEAYVAPETVVINLLPANKNRLGFGFSSSNALEELQQIKSTAGHDELHTESNCVTKQHHSVFSNLINNYGYVFQLPCPFQSSNATVRTSFSTCILGRIKKSIIHVPPESEP